LNADIDQRKIALLRNSEIPFFEPGLKELVNRNAREDRLRFTTDVAEAVRFGDVLFIAVGTPPGPDGAADLSHVFSVARTIAENATKSKIVVTKSTVPIGTGATVQAILDEHGKAKHEAVSNPEFLKEGAAIKDFTDPDRIVVGARTDEAKALMRRIYEPIARSAPSGRAFILEMDVASAEMTKYAANAMLATRISFMNELARVCGQMGADIGLVREGVGLDPRIGRLFLNPGIGYGGSCFPKDVQALVATGQEQGVPLQILEAVHKVNEHQKSYLVELIESFFGDDLSERTFGVWGLAFKPRTDDMREAPSIIILNALLERGATIRAFDPVAHETASEYFGDRITYCESNYDTLREADAMLLLTEWPEFSQPNFDRMKELMLSPIVFDGRNVYRCDRMSDRGFSYFSIGRPPVIQHEPQIRTRQAG
jgi:UDPglucose 6-dehydrogenase